MPQYKLTYFNAKARAEIIRMIFAAADQEYEDVRMTFDEWLQLKPKTPFGQMPILEIDGQVLCQSYVIAFHLAKQFGLAGNTDLEQTKAQMVVGCLNDFRNPVGVARRTKDSSEQKKLMTKFIEDAPTYFNYFDKFVEDSGFFVGNEMTYADITFLHYTDNADEILGQTLDLSRWPKLEALREKVRGHPRIAAWLERRPVTSF